MGQTRRKTMKIIPTLFAASALALLAANSASAAGKPVIGVSWSNFQEERWKTDEAAIKAAIEKAGGSYISADAQSNPGKQLTDIESLITKGANALIVLAQDSDAIRPAIEKATQEGIPVVGYDRLIEIPNADFLFAGQIEVLKAAIDKGDIKNVGEAYTDQWLPANAQKNMEQILTKNNNKVDAVVASNDGTAGGAVAALSAQGLAGSVPVSGQDGDKAALNRVALGTQTVSVWKDARELGKNAAEIAIALAGGKKLTDIAGVQTFSDGPKKQKMTALLLKPIPVTKDNLSVVIDAGWITKDAVCQGVKAGSVSVCK